jgi:hypothetical protein
MMYMHQHMWCWQGRMQDETDTTQVTPIDATAARMRAWLLLSDVCTHKCAHIDTHTRHGNCNSCPPSIVTTHDTGMLPLTSQPNPSYIAVQHSSPSVSNTYITAHYPLNVVLHCSTAQHQHSTPQKHASDTHPKQHPYQHAGLQTSGHLHS